MLQSGSTHLLRDFAEERFGQSLSDSEAESNGSGLEPKMLEERRRPARSRRERLHQTFHVISTLIILALIFSFFRGREDWRRPCVERQIIYCSSNQSLTMSLEIKASILLTSHSISSRAQCAERRIPNLEVQRDLSNILAVQRSAQ